MEFWNRLRQPKKIEKKREGLPEFLHPRAERVAFLGELESEGKNGSLAHVIAFDAVPLVDNIEALKLPPNNFVVKRYDWKKPEWRTIFSKDGVELTVREKASLLKNRHERVKHFFRSLPDLVVPTQFILSGKSEQDGKIYEIQRRIDGVFFGTGVFTSTIVEHALHFSFEKREKIVEDLEEVIRLFSEAIKRGDEKVPDPNFANFVIDKEGVLRLIDTNVEFNCTPEKLLELDRVKIFFERQISEFSYIKKQIEKTL